MLYLYANVLSEHLAALTIILNVVVPVSVCLFHSAQLYRIKPYKADIRTVMKSWKGILTDYNDYWPTLFC